MWEIFIPENIFDKISINKLSDNLLIQLQKHFDIREMSDFTSKYCYWKYIKVNNINQDILSLLNGEFGEKYFLDYDFLKYDLEVTGTKILKPENITQNILQISEEFEEIIKELLSSKLLTLSKKKDIQNKIEKIFFTISWILFLLYSLREKTNKNNEELKNYKWAIEFQAQAKLVSESAQTKYIELTAQIDKFEAKSELFFQAIQKIFL